MTLYEYEQAVEAVGLVPIRIGNASDDWFVTGSDPVIGTKRPRGSEVEITSQAERRKVKSGFRSSFKGVGTAMMTTSTESNNFGLSVAT